MFRKSGTCKRCYASLAPENVQIGFCDACAKQEIAKIKKRILISSLVGAALVALVFASLAYARSTCFVSEDLRYKGDIFVPVFSVHLAFNARSFWRVMNYSLLSKILLGLFCFLAPFASFVNIQYNTFRHKAEQNLYQIGGLGGLEAASSNKQRTDDAGLFIASILISVVSGPFFFVYRVYKLAQLSAHLKKQASAGAESQ